MIAEEERENPGENSGENPRVSSRLVWLSFWLCVAISSRIAGWIQESIKAEVGVFDFSFCGKED